MKVYKYFIKKDLQNNTIEINNKVILKENLFLSEDIGEDGNCFFRSISSYFTNNQKFHKFFRKIVYDYVMANYDQIVTDIPYVYYMGKVVYIDEYIPLIQKNKEFSGEL